MKKNRFLSISSLLLSAICLLLSSCSADVSDDVKTLLGSVPEEAPVVVVVNLDKAIDQCGGKVSKGKLKDFPKNSKMLNGSNNEALAVFTEHKDIFESVKMSAAVLFTYQGDLYVSAFLNDKDEFCDAVAASGKYEKKWNSAGGVDFNGDMAVIDDRMWLCSNADKLERNIHTLMDLSESESFASNKYAENLIAAENAVEMIASIDEWLAQSMSFSQQAQAKMGLNLLFSDPQYVAGKINFSSSEAKFEAELLNGKFKPANCEIEMSKIDPKTVASLGGNADAVMAVSISQKFVNQLADLGKSMGGSLPSDMLSFLSPLDGTIAFASPSIMNGPESMLANFKAVVTTNGRDNAQLAQMLGQLGDVDINGSVFNISKGRYGQGKFVMDEVANQFKDAWLGLAFYVEEDSDKVKCIITLQPNEGSLKLSGSASLL